LQKKKVEMAKATTVERIKRRIANKSQEIFLRDDFVDIAGASQLSLALKELRADGYLVRLGYGVYAKAEISPITGFIRPRQSLEILGSEFLNRRGIPEIMGRAEREYSEGKTTQIPMKSALYTSGRRISRKLQVGKRALIFESTK
jgi:hypothetical protein